MFTHFNVQLCSVFPEDTFRKLSAFEGFIQIPTFKSAVWKSSPSGKKRLKFIPENLMSHTGDVKQISTVLILFCTLSYRRQKQDLRVFISGTNVVPWIFLYSFWKDIFITFTGDKAAIKQKLYFVGS